MGVAYMNIHISRHYKEELAGAINKQLQFISNTVLFRIVIATTKNLKNKAILYLKQ